MLPNHLSYCAASQVQYHSLKPDISHHRTHFRMTAENAAIVVIPVCRMSGYTLPVECIAVRFLLTKCKEGSGNVTEPAGSEERQLPYKTVFLLLIQYTGIHMLLKQGKELSVLTMRKQRSRD